MSIHLDEGRLLARLEPAMDEPVFQRGLVTLTSEPFFVAFFLVSVSQGEGLGEAAVALIGQQEIAGRILDLKRQEEEERGHKEQSIDAARRLFPELFVDGRYRYEKSLQGQPYYVAVLEANRARLKQRDRYSRLNLYLTTTFGYEIMVVLLYRAVADAIAASALPNALRDDVVAVLERILSEEETHLGVIDQHNGLLETERADLSPDACVILDALERLGADDYEFAAELAVRQVVKMMEQYAEADSYRAAIESGITGGS